MSPDPLDSILYVVAGISVASGMPHPSSLKKQVGFLFFWYSWLFASCQAFAQNAGRINPSMGGFNQKLESSTLDARGNITHQSSETAVVSIATPAPNGQKE